MLKLEPKKIIIAFDQHLVADGLKLILSNQNEFTVQEIVSNDENVVESVQLLKPELIIFEFLYWKTKYNETIAKFHQIFPELKIVIISELVSHEILRSIMPNINAYVLRTCSSEKLILGIHEVITSGKYLCPKAIDEYFKCTRTVSTDTELTAREKEVLCTWMESKGNHEIAGNLNISESTVRTHLNNIRQKLGNLNHLQMMIYACKQNIMNRNFRPICPNCRSFCG